MRSPHTNSITYPKCKCAKGCCDQTFDIRLLTPKITPGGVIIGHENTSCPCIEGISLAQRTPGNSKKSTKIACAFCRFKQHEHDLRSFERLGKTMFICRDIGACRDRRASQKEPTQPLAPSPVPT